jgi:hypothetical protein
MALLLQLGLVLWWMAGFTSSGRLMAQEPTPMPKVLDLAKAGTIDFAIIGASGGDNIEKTVIADVNADGIDDVVIAALQSNGPDGLRFDAGGVFVVFGGIDFITGGVRDLEVRADVVIHGAEADDRFGTSLVVGDVNGDGTVDIVVGAPRNNGPGNSRAFGGAVYVIFGGPQLVTGTVRDMAGQIAPGADVVILGAETQDHLGASLAIGDINGDHIQDIIAGSADASFAQGPRLFSGTLYAIFGSASMVSGIVRDLLGTLAHGPDLTVRGPTSLSFFGFQVAVGDVNGDHLSDIVVSAPLSDGPEAKRTDAGEVYVIFGSQGLPSGTVRDIASTAPSGADVTLYGGETTDLFGFRLMIADVTGDGIGDIVAGAIQADGPENKRKDVGEVYIFFGGAGLIRGTTRDVAKMSGAGPDVTLYGAEEGDTFGDGLTVSDVDGNGKADLLVGAPDADADKNEKASAGEVYIFFDKSISAKDTVRDVGGEAKDQPEVIIRGSTAGDLVGTFVAVADVNADGKADLLLSAPGVSSLKFGAGAIFILFGPKI